MNIASLSRSLIFLAATGLAFTNADAAPPNLKNGLAIQGYDPVSYFDGSPAKGKSFISHEYQGATYHFATEENRDTFTANPARYVPVAGGWCAWAMLESDTVKINPESYKIIDGKLHLFYDGILGDTRANWNALAATESEKALAGKVAANWSKLARDS